MSKLPLAVTQAFETLGLNKKQITVLGHLYSLGRVRVHEISKDTKGIKRPELYSILNHLVKIQLVERINLNNVASFELKKDSEIIRWANRKRIEAEHHHESCVVSTNQIKNFIVSQKREIAPRPIFHFFEGGKGLETLHRNIISKAKYVDIYMNYASLSKHYPEYETLASRIAGDNPKVKIRIIIIDEIHDVIPKKLRTNPQLFLRSNKGAEEHIFTCVGDKWMVNFVVEGELLKGFYMNCKHFDSFKMLRTNFQKDWEASAELN